MIKKSADPFDIRSLIQARSGDGHRLHHEHINPQFAKVLRTIGFDRIWVRAEGPYLWDREGRRFVDYLAGYGVYNMGRNHPVIKKALADFLELDHPSLIQMEAPLTSGLLAEELKKRVPAELDTVYFTNSGTEGNETAIKFAHCATRKPRLLYCHHAFHGLSNGSLSINGEGWFRDGFDPLLPATTMVELNDLDALERELRRDDVAAFIFEAIQGKSCAVAGDEYLRAAAELCRRHGALLVADEVQCGLGRSGRFFAYEQAGITPDIVVISKSLSGGFVPVGAVLTRRAIYDKVFSSMDRCVVHSSTFGQGAFAMVAALAALHVIDQEGLVENARLMGERLLRGLRELQGRFELIQDVRGRGLMVGIEFGRPKSLTLRVGWDLIHKVNDGLFGQAIVIPLFADHGILTQVAGKGQDVIKLIPPLTIGAEDVDYFLKAFEEVLERCHRFPGPIWEVASRMAKFAVSRRN